MVIEGNRLIADEDKWLTNGFTVGKTVYLSANDDISNWSEISNEEMFGMECEMFG
jgi:hypothetical protein